MTKRQGSHGKGIRWLGPIVVASLLYTPVAQAEGPPPARAGLKDKARVIVDKDCPAEKEFKNRLKAGIREANLALFPLAAVEVTQEAGLVADTYWTERKNDFIDAMRKRAKTAGAIKAKIPSEESLDARSGLTITCSAVASRDASLCEGPTEEQRSLCHLEVGIFSDSCDVAGVHAPACEAVKNAKGGSCVGAAAGSRACMDLAKIKQSIVPFCGDESARTPTPECLAALIVRARLNRAQSCADRPGLKSLTALCTAMVTGTPDDCSTAKVFGKGKAESSALVQTVEGMLYANVEGKTELLLLASASRRALCMVDATVHDAAGTVRARFQDVIRVIEGDESDTVSTSILEADVDPFTFTVKVESHCVRRYWW